MRYVVTADQMRAIDRATIDEIGLPGAVLMETAGRAVAEVVRARRRAGATVAVVCGAGNNGGDGYVAARVLREWGYAASAYLAADRAKVAGDAALHLRVLEQCGGRVASIATEADLLEHERAIERADVVVDALFGTGLARDVTGHYARVVAVLNRARGFKVAVDIPSGLAADTGAVLGVAFNADATVTMAFDKPALVSSPGFARCGEVTVAEIGIPAELARVHGVSLAVFERDDAAAALPATTPVDHKGRRGHALVIAGSPGKWGAGRMAARAALRAGAGLVTLAGPRADAAAPDEVMTAAIDPEAAGFDVALAELLAGKRAVAIGPGMPATAAGAALVRAVLERAEVPVVIDADALNHMAGDLAAVAAARAPVVLTPHPGEAGRLLGCSAADIERDRIAAVRRLAERTRAVVVLKGARTLVCDGAVDGFTTVNPTGNAAMATAGAGDVLTGVIVALAAQGAPPADAARAGVFLHGLAGDRAARGRIDAGLMAGDLIDELPRARADLTRRARPAPVGAEGAGPPD
ncbi:MAG: NAD(P)H-hydrate dehydratase [Deltaproteobacteria bacterium]|nr:MAG: NAD(P)H-hydrate dehydratase [Deltaproteobacteria bacterium]